MTQYANFINTLKSQCDKSWLTPSQRSIFDKLDSGFTTQRVVNVYGAEGTGKTFLGWILEKENMGKYFVNVEDLKQYLISNHGPNGIVAVIDNFPADRKAHRDFRSKMLDMGVERSVVLTQFAIPDDVPKLLLEFRDQDRQHFKHTCYSKARLQITVESERDNMHSLIKNNIWKWSDAR